MIDWVELVKTVGGVLISVIAAIAFLIAVIKGKDNKDLKKKNQSKELEIKHLHNGFRESVDQRLAILEKRTCNKCGFKY